MVVVWAWTLAWAAPVGGGPAYIVGGDEVDARPEVVAVLRRGEVFCSGTLITPDAVLTAGHCADDADQVVVGAADWRAGSRLVVERASRADGVLEGRDVAVLHLASSADGPPATLMHACAAEGLVEGAAVEIAGYGRISADGLQATDTLRAADTVVVDPTCAQTGLGCNRSLPAGAELIAGGEGVDTCIHDSGGPLWLAATGELAGVTSRGVLGSRDACGDGGIFTRVDGVTDWLVADLGLEVRLSACAPPPSHNRRSGCAHVDPAGLAILGLLWARRRR